VLTVLFRSMSKHIRKVNAAARREQEAAASAQDPSADRGGPP